MIFRMIWKSGQIFLPFCHIHTSDGQTDEQTDRILIARLRRHSMQRSKKLRLAYMLVESIAETSFVMSARPDLIDYVKRCLKQWNREVDITLETTSSPWTAVEPPVSDNWPNTTRLAYLSRFRIISKFCQLCNFYFVSCKVGFRVFNYFSSMYV